MEVIAAAGLCAPGCGAIVSAIAGGPVLGAMSMMAAVGYGIYSYASGKGGDDFQDAVEGESDDVIKPVVVVAKQGGTTKGHVESRPDTGDFL